MTVDQLIRALLGVYGGAHPLVHEAAVQLNTLSIAIASAPHDEDCGVEQERQLYQTDDIYVEPDTGIEAACNCWKRRALGRGLNPDVGTD